MNMGTHEEARSWIDRRDRECVKHERVAPFVGYLRARDALRDHDRDRDAWNETSKAHGDDP